MPDSPSLLAPLLSFVAGALTAIFAEPIRRRLFRPVLTVEFDSERCVIKTPTFVGGVNSRGYWIRVRVKNTGGGRVAKGCSAYLVNVERQERGEFVKTIFADSLHLNWSSQIPNVLTETIEIPRDVTQFADVFSTDESAPNQYQLQTSVVPFYCKDLFDSTPKTLRLTILVTGDEVTPHMTHFVFDWKGQWNNFETRAE